MQIRLFAFLSATLVWGQTAELQMGRQLEAEGKLHEAFRSYLSGPNAEYLAARLARPHAKEYLALTEPLLASGDDALRTRARLVRGDLLLVMEDRAGALALYRQVAASYAGQSRYPMDPGQRPRMQ